MSPSEVSPLILVVDDDESTRDTVAEVLDSAGLPAITADSGAAALTLARLRRPTITLLDHRLPDARGTDLVASLKELDPRMPVLLITGYASLESAMHAVGQFDEYLVKPVEPTRLIQSIQAALERRRLVEENAALLDQLQEANGRLATEMAAREQQLAGLVAFSLAVSREDALGGTIEAALQAVVAEVGLIPAAVYVKPDDADGELLLAGCRGDNWEPPLSIPVPVGPVDNARRGSPPLPVDIVRITDGGGLVGALVVNHGGHGPEFLRALGAQLGLAIGNAQRLERESEAVRRLTELARLRSSLIAGVSHELRTPLTAMIGLAQTIRMRDLPAALQQDFLDQILRQSNRLKGLVGDLLDETRLETGVLQVHCQPVELSAVLSAVASSFLHVAQTLAIDSDSDLPFVWADEHRLEQVLVNLVHNATKYAPERSTIRLRADLVGEAVTVSVADDGPGIDPAFLPRVFDAFAQGHSSDTGRDSGLGLGLSIAHGLVDAMGGSITVESNPGEGAVFTLRLTVADTAAPAANAAGNVPWPRTEIAEATYGVTTHL